MREWNEARRQALEEPLRGPVHPLKRVAPSGLATEKYSTSVWQGETFGEQLVWCNLGGRKMRSQIPGMASLRPLDESHL